MDTFGAIYAEINQKKSDLSAGGSWDIEGKTEKFYIFRMPRLDSELAGVGSLVACRDYTTAWIRGISPGMPGDRRRIQERRFQI